jgi:hypothetical protein
MTARLTSLDVRKVGDKTWELLSPFVVTVVVDGKSYLIRVPPGFVTDFASVPRIPLVFFLFGGIGDYGAVVHDWLYTTREYPRALCDAIFEQVLIHIDKTSEFRAGAMHLGVRLGGGSAYSGS